MDKRKSCILSVGSCGFARIAPDDSWHGMTDLIWLARVLAIHIQLPRPGLVAHLASWRRIEKAHGETLEMFLRTSEGIRGEEGRMPRRYNELRSLSHLQDSKSNVSKIKLAGLRSAEKRLHKSQHKTKKCSDQLSQARLYQLANQRLCAPRRNYFGSDSIIKLEVE